MKHAVIVLLVTWGFWSYVKASHEIPQKTAGSDLSELKDEIEASLQLPAASEKAMLNIFGSSLVRAGSLPCNIFGGKAACTAVPADSKLAKNCPGVHLEVDCAFKTEALEELGNDPNAVMRKKIASEGYPPCNPCFRSLHKFWCGQTVPTCGTFEKLLDEILPVLSTVSVKKVNPLDAMKAATPRVLAAFSLGLPCREMCLSVAKACGCGGKPATFGQLMTTLQSDKGMAQRYGTNMSVSTAREIFSGIWEKPLCDLFAPSNMPGFSGTCELPLKEEAKEPCEWCTSKHKPADVDEQIVAQMAQSISGMMQMGLQRVLDAVDSGHVKRASSRSPSTWDWADEVHEEPSPPAKSHHGGFYIFVLLVVFALVIAAAGFAVYVYVQRSRALRSHYEDLNSLGYNPPQL